MARARRNASHDIDEDRDAPDQADLDRFGGDSDECPSCGRSLYDDASICPHCLEVIDRASSGCCGGGGRFGRPPLWLVVTLGLVVAALLAPFVLPLLR